MHLILPGNMKKFLNYNRMLFKMVMMAILTNVFIASGQTGNKQQLVIPENVNAIFQIKCMSCHGKEGGRFPKSKLNFSRWTAYDASRQAEKASLICSEVSKAKMPPKSARESTPGLIPTKEQIDLICKWAESIQSVKGKK
jgi:hypothetical protein